MKRVKFHDFNKPFDCYKHLIWANNIVVGLDLMHENLQNEFVYLQTKIFFEVKYWIKNQEKKVL